MKVLLVNPFQVRLVGRKGRIYNRTWLPLDLAYCAALVRDAGADVTVLDANALRLGPAAVASRAAGFDKVFLTSTSLDRWQCPHLDLQPFLDTVHAVRPVVGEVHVLGSHGTVRPREILEATGADTVVRGEPELTVRDLCTSADRAAVRGITYRRDGVIHDNPDQAPVVMDALPLPAFDLLPMDRYRYEIMGDRFALFEMSRGCASKCTFCLLKTYGPGVRKKSVETLAREVEHGVKTFGVRHAYFIDLEFTVLRKQVVEFCQHLIRAQHNFTWCCQTRFDLVDPELLALMKRAGCTLIHFGVEAGSDRVLDLVDKRITMAKIRDGMKMAKAAKIRSATFFMIGFPESTEQDMRDIVAFARELQPDYPVFHIAAPYPGTRLYEQVKNDPSLRFSDDTLFPEAVEGRFTVRQLKAMTRKAYLSYYLQPSFLLSRLRQADLGGLLAQARLFLSFVRG